MVANKFYVDFGITPIQDKKYLGKQELHNIFKKPKKDSYINEPHIQVRGHNQTQQADLLFLPDDNGYKYALVVVDLGSRLTDAEPLKNKDADTVRDAFKTIYKRGILKIPKRLEVDPGGEFKGATKRYFESKDTHIRYGKVGRSRQQALAERRNQTIGDALIKRMTAQELLTGQVSSEWIDDLPVVIKALNDRYENKPMKQMPDQPVCEGDACNILERGTKVRVILDEPREVTQGIKLHGPFRSADVRWNPDVRIVKEVLLKPGYPPMYLLDGKIGPRKIDPTPYTKSHLQVIKSDEQPPDPIVIRGKPESYVAEKILDKKKVNGRIYYLVKWERYDETTWEPRSTLIEDVPDLVEEYEADINT